MMRRWFFAFLAAAAGCGPVDARTPYRSPAYVLGQSRIKAAVHQFEGHEAAFLAGWSRVEIDVPDGAPLAGYRRGDGAHEGVRDPVCVRAFSISHEGGAPLLFLVADLIAVDRGLADEVRRRLRDEVPPDRVRFSASHTHSSLGGYVSHFLFELTTGEFYAPAFEAVVDAHVDAARLALAEMAPARIGSAEARAPGLCANRVRTGAPVDDALLVLYFEHLEAGGRAALVNHACHPVIFREEHRQISADYPGELAARFERRALDVLGLAAGAVGNAEPRVATLEAMAEGLTEPLFEALSEARANARPSGLLIATQVELPLPRLSVQLLPGLVLWSPVAQAALRPRFSFELSVVGEAALLGLPVELAGHLGRAWRQRTAKQGFRLFLLALGGDYLGYVNARETFGLEVAERGPGYDNELVTLGLLGPSGAELVLGLGDTLLSGLPRR
jgi:hypothetical protein